LERVGRAKSTKTNWTTHDRDNQLGNIRCLQHPTFSVHEKPEVIMDFIEHAKNQRLGISLSCWTEKNAAVRVLRALTKLLAASVLFQLLLLSFNSTATAAPHWRSTGDVFPDTLTQVRAMVVRQDKLYVGVGGNAANCAQIWKLTEAGWVKHLEFKQKKVAVLQTDDKGRLFVGMGTQHSAEGNGPGEAEFRVYGANDELIFQKTFWDKDVIYSMAWYNGKLHIGTMAEDIPGSAEIWKFDEPGWTRIAGDGIQGWPKRNTYAAVYEMHVHDGQLFASTFSRTMGDGDVLKLTPQGWVDQDVPRSLIDLAFIDYRGKLITALDRYKAPELVNPIFTLQTNKSWLPLGKAPAEWKDAHIFNHFAIIDDELYVGVGGLRGTLSVWKFDGRTWSKVGGDGIYGSWQDPLVKEGSNEWIYRMIVHKGKLYVGLASDSSSLAKVWEMTPRDE